MVGSDAFAGLSARKIRRLRDHLDDCAPVAIHGLACFTFSSSSFDDVEQFLRRWVAALVHHHSGLIETRG